MVSHRVVTELDLETVGKIQYRHQQGMDWFDAYLFRVAFYDGDAPTDPTDKTPTKIRVWHGEILGAEIADPPDFDVLLGMDIITTGELRIMRNGTYTFSFN